MRTILISIATAVMLAACAPTPVYQPAPIQVAPAPAPQETAAQANINAYMVSLQTALSDKGYSPGRIDGRCGPKTIGAIADYQHALGVPVSTDGSCRVDDKTWSSLGLSPGTGDPHQRKLELN